MFLIGGHGALQCLISVGIGLDTNLVIIQKYFLSVKGIEPCYEQFTRLIKGQNK